MGKNKQKETIAVIVNGEKVDVPYNENAPIRTLVNKALELSGNVGRPIEDWVLRDPNKNEIPLDRKIEEFEFADDVVLTLDLIAGVGGVNGARR